MSTLSQRYAAGPVLGSIAGDTIGSVYEFDETCPGSVPQTIEAFLEATDFESTVRLCVSIGGDCDTTAAIAGGIAH